MFVITFIRTKWRFFIVLLAGLIGLAALGVKGFINAKNPDLKTKSKNVILRSAETLAPRGSILDVHGRVLAVDIPFYQYNFDVRFLHKKLEALNNSDQKFDFLEYLHRQEVKNIVRELESILDLPENKFQAALENFSKIRHWRMKNKVTLQEHLDVQALRKRMRAKAIDKREESKQKYLIGLSKLRQEKAEEFLRLTYQKNYYLEVKNLRKKAKALELFFASISADKYYRRSYPYKNVFSELLGHMRIDKGREPFDGAEKNLDSVLRGKNGQVKYFKNAKSAMVEIVDSPDSKAMQAGKDVRLTVDYTLQHTVNRELYKQMHTHKAKSASALLVDVKSGAVKAIVSQPNYNPNDISERTGYRTRLRPLLDYIEPGSVQKPLLMATGLENGELSVESTVSITRTNRFSWRDSPLIEPRYAKPTSVGMSDVIKYSINTGIIKFAERVKKEHLWELFYKLGYGFEYDIFSGEKGISSLSHSDNWNDSEYFTRTYGYVEHLNIFNIIAFYLAVANQGVLPPLHLLPKTKAQIKDKSTRVLSTQTATIMSDFLYQATQGRGTARRAKVKGIKVAGKTGTTRKGGISVLKYRATFVGFAPVQNPRYVLAIIVDEPSQSEEFYSGGRVVAPLFSKIIEQVLQHK